jgi:hypothetical protein
MSPHDFEMTTSQIDVVINIADSVDFKLRLDLSMKINAVGAFNVLNFAHCCPKIIGY